MNIFPGEEPLLLLIAAAAAVMPRLHLIWLEVGASAFPKLLQGDFLNSIPGMRFVYIIT